MKELLRKHLRAALLISALMLASGIVGAISVNATILSSPSAIDSQYSCDKGVNFFISVDNSASPVYYATAGLNTIAQTCGTLAFGGPNNAGGKVGTNATQVIQAALNALPTGTSLGLGELFFEAGNYTIRTLSIPVSDHSNVILDGQGDLNTILTYQGSATKQVIWVPYTFAKASCFVSHLNVEMDNLKIHVSSNIYTGNAVDLTCAPEVTMNHMLIEAKGAVGNTGSIGIKKDLPKGDGNAKEFTDVAVSGFGTDIQWSDDLAVFTGIYLDNYLTVGFRFGNNTALGISGVTLINPHLRNNNVLLAPNHGFPLAFNYTTTTQGAQVTIIQPFFEPSIVAQCQVDLRGTGGSEIVMTGYSDGTANTNDYPSLCLPVAADLSHVQFHLNHAPGLQGFPYTLVCKYFGISSSRLTCTGSSRSATPTSGNVYQDILVPTFIQISGGTGVNITVNTPTNANIAGLKSLATLGVGAPFELPVGYKLIVTFATPPTTTAYVVAN